MAKVLHEDMKVERDMSAVQAAFIEWLVDPQREGSQADFARANNVVPKTLSRWKRDPAFREAWDQRCVELNVDPGRLQEVIDALHRKAIEGDSRAANLYLQYVDRFTPKRVVIEERSAKDLTDDELAEALESSARHLRAV